MNNMNNLMQQALGDDWHKLPPVLQAHHAGCVVDQGEMDIEYPRWMQPLLLLLRLIGALIDRPGKAVATRVEKRLVDGRQTWHRTMIYADGQRKYFNSVWLAAGERQIVEYVNPWLGLQIRPYVVDDRLYSDGVCFVLRVWRWQLRIPENYLLGHTTIVETAIDEHRFAMDFRLTHPWFGQVFRYAGKFASMPA